MPLYADRSTAYQICTHVLHSACCMTDGCTLQSSQMLHDTKLHQAAGQKWMMQSRCGRGTFHILLVTALPDQQLLPRLQVIHPFCCTASLPHWQLHCGILLQPYSLQEAWQPVSQLASVVPAPRPGQGAPVPHHTCLMMCKIWSKYVCFRVFPNSRISEIQPRP